MASFNGVKKKGDENKQPSEVEGNSSEDNT